MSVDLVIGADPGLHGALAFYYPKTGALLIYDIPTHTLTRNGKNKSEIDVMALANIAACAFGAGRAHAFIEAVGSMPGQGVSSVFAFGKAYGILLGVLAGLPRTDVRPQVWKKALGVPADKDGARARASQLFPAYAAEWKLVKHDGRAEAALIALYGAQTLKSA